MFRFGWAVSLTGCRRTERTPEDRKAQQTAKDEHPENAVDRPGEQIQKETFDNTYIHFVKSCMKNVI
jgi:hypothetical protein